MRETTETYSRTGNQSLPSRKIQTTYSNKVISLELSNDNKLNVIHCSFKNGKLPPDVAILEKAVHGYDFKEIAMVKDCNPELFRFEDEINKLGDRCKYRVLIREQSGVTYYSEIISY